MPRKSRKSSSNPKKDLLDEFLDGFDEAVFDVRDDRKQMAFEVQFIHSRGAQWDEVAVKIRKDRPRPEINLLVKALEVVKGEQKQSRVNSKVRATGGKATEAIAKTREGLLRTVSVDPRTVAARDGAFNECVDSGMGAYLVGTEDVEDRSFDVNPVVKSIKNAIESVFWTVGGIDDNHRDSLGCFVISDMPIKQFEHKYPKSKVCSKTAAGGFSYVGINGPRKGWRTENLIRICDFYVKEPVEKTFGLFTGGAVYEIDKDTLKVMDELEDEGIELLKDANGNDRTKTVKTFKVMHYRFSGCEFLQDPIEFPSQMIPVVTLYGFTFWDNEGRHPYGLGRHAIDSQRDFNYTTGQIQETGSLSAKDPLFATKVQIEGYENDYAKMGATNPPVLFYNNDPKNPGPPKRLGAPAFQSALSAQLQNAAQNIKSTTGIHDQSLGLSQSGQSGRAIIAEQAQGRSATFTIKDSLAKAITYESDVVMQVFENTIDTERQERMVREDGETEIVSFVNKEVVDEESGETVLLKDFRQGKYDVTITIGPSFATKRQENLELMMTAAGQIPELGAIAADLIAGEMDIEKAGELRSRLRQRLIQSGVVTPTDSDIDEFVKAMTNRQKMAQVVQQSGENQPSQAEEIAGRMQQASMENELLESAATIDKTRSETVMNLSKALDVFRELPQTQETVNAINAISAEISETLQENDEEPSPAPQARLQAAQTAAPIGQA